MESTNFFLDQAVVGVLVMAAVTLLLPPEITPYLWGLSFEKVVGVLLLGYVAGILYDRIGDTLLEDLESHRRLWTALYRTTRGDSPEETYAEDEYRAEVIREESSAAYMNYLRSRMRLARATATLAPALVATALGISWHDLPHQLHAGGTPAWTPLQVERAFAWPLVLYPLALVTKLLRRDRRRWGWFMWILRGPWLPRTKDLVDKNYRGRYCDQVRWNAKERRPDGLFLWFLFRLERLMILLLVFAVWTAWQARGHGAAYAAVSGLAVLAATLLAGWTWWRIMATYTNFITTVHDLRERERAWR